jgi:hypothetical protein
MGYKANAQKNSTLVSIAAGGGVGAGMYWGAGFSAPVSVAGAVAVGAASKWALSTNKKVTTVKSGDISARIHKGKKETIAIVSFPTEMMDVDWNEVKDFVGSKEGKTALKMLAEMGAQLGDQVTAAVVDDVVVERTARKKATAS